MPSICRFAGIVIYMYYNDHLPPHFHAQYSGQVMEVTISPVGILRGSLPSTQTRMVLDWAQRHQNELMTNWNLARANQPPLPIAP